MFIKTILVALVILTGAYVAYTKVNRTKVTQRAIASSALEKSEKITNSNLVTLKKECREGESYSCTKVGKSLFTADRKTAHAFFKRGCSLGCGISCGLLRDGY